MGHRAVDWRPDNRRPGGHFMNYRHHYHAGNFADVVKHIVLARVIEYMKRKPAPFRVIDTHAGAGLYDLEGLEAGKTQEWRDGIGRVMSAAFEPDVAALLEPYLAVVSARNTSGDLKSYPGSPLIAQALLRRADALVANELRAEDFAALKENLKQSRSATTLNIDGWTAVRSLLPPKERRGLVLIDPPFEARDEFAKMSAAVADALTRFAGGTLLFWYPVKDAIAAEKFYEHVAARDRLKFLEVRFAIAAAFPGLGLTEIGLLVINPPHVLASELEQVLPPLARLLADGEGSGYRIRTAAA